MKIFFLEIDSCDGDKIFAMQGAFSLELNHLRLDVIVAHSTNIIFSELTLGTELAATTLGEFLTAYQDVAGVGALLISTASAIVQALVELGPGTCLSDSEISIIDDTLSVIPDL